jgi:hypothetical protein
MPTTSVIMRSTNYENETLLIPFATGTLAVAAYVNTQFCEFLANENYGSYVIDHLLPIEVFVGEMYESKTLNVPDYHFDAEDSA